MPTNDASAVCKNSMGIFIRRNKVREGLSKSMSQLSYPYSRQYWPGATKRLITSICVFVFVFSILNYFCLRLRLFRIELFASPSSSYKEGCPKVVLKLPESCPQVLRKLPESCPEVARKLTEKCAKVAERQRQQCSRK